MHLQRFRSALRAGRAVALLAVVLLSAAPAPSPRAAASGPHAPAAPACASTSTLYDGALGGTPGTQGLLYQSFAVSATQTFSNGVTILDTTPRQSDLAGYVGNPASVPALDRTSGYTLTFGVQVVSEAHTNNNRAGFSVIALSQDKLGIELGFWSDHIWAQEGGTDPNLFTHSADDVLFTTTTGLISYTLAIHGGNYALAANGAPILNGNLRDYSAFAGFPDPYETPNFIFLGDDTSSAKAKIRLAAFAVTVTKCTRYLPLITVAG
jgi:hypothetical protein